jgi:hypothetical protein
VDSHPAQNKNMSQVLALGLAPAWQSLLALLWEFVLVCKKLWA